MHIFLIHQRIEPFVGEFLLVFVFLFCSKKCDSLQIRAQ